MTQLANQSFERTSYAVFQYHSLAQLPPHHALLRVFPRIGRHAAPPLGIMDTFGGRFKIPLNTYHGVPAGWSRAEVIANHAALNGRYIIQAREVTEPGAPSWLPDRENWLYYRDTLYRIADGVRAGDPACIELATRYIEARPIGSYSGFIRARLARALYSASLSGSQTFRLNRHFCSLVQNRDYTQDFVVCAKLWSRFASPEARDMISKVAPLPLGRRPKWLRHFMSTATPRP